MDIGWFFFDLLLLGYVEDPSTGISFCSSEERELEIYIEVLIFYQATYERKRLKCVYLCVTGLLLTAL